MTVTFPWRSQLLRAESFTDGFIPAMLILYGLQSLQAPVTTETVF